MPNTREKKISGAELSNFCGQVALILEAGLPLYDGMQTLAGADAKSSNADMYQAASRGVTETGSLYDALREDGRWPKYLVEMAGEKQVVMKMKELWTYLSMGLKIDKKQLKAIHKATHLSEYKSAVQMILY